MGVVVAWNGRNEQSRDWENGENGKNRDSAAPAKNDSTAQGKRKKASSRMGPAGTDAERPVIAEKYQR